VIRILIRAGDAGDKILLRLARDLAIDAALLSARVDEVGGQQIGSVTLGVPGNDAAVCLVLSYLSQHQLATERLGYVA
jgi:D-methionine transport system ATP-binding protein